MASLLPFCYICQILLPFPRPRFSKFPLDISIWRLHSLPNWTSFEPNTVFLQVLAPALLRSMDHTSLDSGNWNSPQSYTWAATISSQSHLPQCLPNLPLLIPTNITLAPYLTSHLCVTVALPLLPSPPVPPFSNPCSGHHQTYPTIASQVTLPLCTQNSIMSLRCQE